MVQSYGMNASPPVDEQPNGTQGAAAGDDDARRRRHGVSLQQRGGVRPDGQDVLLGTGHARRHHATGALDRDEAGKDSFLSQVIDLVKQAQNSKSKTQNLADTAAMRLTVIALGDGVNDAPALA